MFPQWEKGQADLFAGIRTQGVARHHDLGDTGFVRVGESTRVSACPIDDRDVPAPDRRQQGGHLRHRRMFAWRTREWLRIRVGGRRSEVAWGTTCRPTCCRRAEVEAVEATKHRGVQEQIHAPCRAGFVTKKAQPAPFDVPDSVRMGRRIGDSLPKDGSAQGDSPQIAWSFTRETSRNCQFDTLTLPKNVTEQRIHARDRRPLAGPTDSQQGAAKADANFSS